MSDTPTPRTDAVERECRNLEALTPMVEHARQLERNLAAMREERDAIKSGVLETHTAFCKLGFEVEALRERAEKAERERDEAQELMESESSWADGYHSHWVKAARDLAETRHSERLAQADAEESRAERDAYRRERDEAQKELEKMNDYAKRLKEDSLKLVASVDTLARACATYGIETDEVKEAAKILNTPDIEKAHPATPVVHAADCAVALNARHECSCQPTASETRNCGTCDYNDAPCDVCATYNQWQPKGARV